MGFSTLQKSPCVQSGDHIATYFYALDGEGRHEKIVHRYRNAYDLENY
jgi:hypothetical protein